MTAKPNTVGLAWELLAQCDAYSEALDRLFVHLVIENNNTYHPTQTGKSWDTAVQGNVLRERARRELPRPDAEAIEAAPMLKDKKALVLYFDSDIDRDECVAALTAVYRGMRTVKV